MFGATVKHKQPDVLVGVSINELIYVRNPVHGWSQIFV